jgi:hypothetical protein
MSVPGSPRLLRRRAGVAALLAGLVAAGCSSSRSQPAAPPVASTASGAQSAPAPAAPVWLCQPGTNPDPCTADLDAYSVAQDGTRTELASAPAASSPFDCFYVYPTVSPEKGPNADLRIQPAEVSVAEQQASRFSTVCRVWAPMYRQVTLDALFSGGLPALQVAYQSLASDWAFYLAHDNDGRPFILIGHSQGAAMLIRLIAEQIDSNPSVRSRLVVAILAGGNLQVPAGATVGATFKHIPLCTSSTQAGCAIAYSSFGSPPPAGSLFGRPGTGVSLLSLQLTAAGQQVACVNPAALAGGAAPLEPYFRDGGAVPWVTYPDLYQATCQSAGGATWLQVKAVAGPGDTRPVVQASLGPAWGLHVYDVNLALGNLVSDVATLEGAYRSTAPSQGTGG